MGRRDRERKQRIRMGQETPFAEQRRMEQLQRISEKYGGEPTAQALADLAAEGKLRIGRGRHA